MHRLLIIPSLLFLCGHLSASELKTVRDFGATGDGRTDDSSAIQKAVDSGIGSVTFPKGTYRISKTIKINLKDSGFTSFTSDGTSSLVMAGAGPALHFIGTHEGSADPGQFKEGVWEKERMPLVRGMEIVGANPEADGIESTGVMQLTITETRIHRVRHAINLTKRNRNVLISACHLYENSGCGVLYNQVNLHQSNIIGCHISYNAMGGIVFRGGNVRNAHIGTCDIESNMKPDGPPTANILIDSTGGSTAEVAITGCTIQHNSKSPGSANIRILGKGDLSPTDRSATQEGHVTITGNVFSDVMVNIHLEHARGVNITGNSFWEGFEHDLLVENSQCIIVSSNDFDRNPRYSVNGNWSKDRNGLVFRNSADCKLSGLLIKGVWQKEAAVFLENCDRFTISDCSIFDSDNVGLWLKGVTRSVVSGCVIRDDRPEKKARLSLKLEGGSDNWIHGGVFPNGVESDEKGAWADRSSKP